MTCLYIACFGIARADNIAIASTAWSAATNLIVAVYPITVFWKLQMRIGIKIGLCALWSTVAFSSVCACIRTYEIGVIESTTDRTHAVAPLLIWGWTEYWVVLIAGSLPPLRPLFPRIVQYFKGQNGPNRGLHAERSAQELHGQDLEMKSHGRAAYGVKNPAVERSASSTASSHGQRSSSGEEAGREPGAETPPINVTIQTDVYVTSEPMNEEARKAESSTKRESIRA